MKSNLLGLFLLVPFILNAQTRTLSASNQAATADYRMQNTYMSLVNNLDKSLYVNESKVTGSKYFIDSFLLGKVFVNNKAAKELFAVRYNAYYDMIEVKKENETEALIKAVNVSCSIAGKLYIYQKYLPKKSSTTKLGYLIVLHEAKNVSLLKQESVNYKEAKPAKTSLTVSIPAKFVQVENYFFLNKGEDAALLITKKNILNAFDDSFKSNMKSFIKKEKIDLKKERDLIKLFSHYNSLENDLN